MNPSFDLDQLQSPIRRTAAPAPQRVAPLDIGEILRRFRLQNMISPAPNPVLFHQIAKEFPPPPQATKTPPFVPQSKVQAPQQAPQGQVQQFPTPPQIQGQAPPQPQVQAPPQVPLPIQPQMQAPFPPGVMPFPPKQTTLPVSPSPVEQASLETPPQLQLPQDQIPQVPGAMTGPPAPSQVTTAPRSLNQPLPQSMEEYRQRILQGFPSQQQYEQQNPVSRLRHLGAILAGVGMGIGARDPGIGMQMYSHLQHGPYQQAAANWQAGTQRLGDVVALDLSRREAAIKDEMEGLKEAQEKSLTGKTQAETKLSEHQEKILAPSFEAAQQAAQTKTELAHPEMPMTVRLRGSSEYLHGVTWVPPRRQPDGTMSEGHYEYQGTRLDPKTFVSAPVREGEKVPKASDYLVALEAKARDLGKEVNELSYPEARQVYLELHPKSTYSDFYRSLQAENLALKTGEERRKVEARPGNIKGYIRTGLRDPDTLAEEKISPDLFPDVQNAWSEATNYPFPKKLKANMINRLNNANTSYDHVDQIQAMLKTTEGQRFLAKFYGPFMGRFVKGATDFGDIPGMTNEDKKFAGNMAFRLTALKTQETAAVSAGRYSVQLQNMMSKATPSEHDTAAIFLGKLKGSKDIANLVRVEANEDRFGSMGSVMNPATGQKMSTYKVIDGVPYIWDFKASDWKSIEIK